jgi:hypothetical protein
MSEIVINIFGMRRSGLHCIVDDIIKHWNKENNCNLVFYNDAITTNYTPISNSVFLFEDQINYITTNYKEYNVIIIRDIYDNIISRIGKNKKWSQVNRRYIKTIKTIIKEFLEIENNIPNKILINYNKYILDTDYRNDILKNYFQILNIKKFSNEIPGFGGGKTFNNDDLRNEVKIDNHTYSHIENDLELLDLVEKYFGYYLLDKLKKHL